MKQDPDAVPPSAKEYVASVLKREGGRTVHLLDMTEGFAKVRREWKEATSTAMSPMSQKPITTRGASSAISRALGDFIATGQVKREGIYDYCWIGGEV